MSQRKPDTTIEVDLDISELEVSSAETPDTTIEVDLDISELEVSSAETKATYEEIKSYVLKKFGLKVSTAS